MLQEPQLCCLCSPCPALSSPRHRRDSRVPFLGMCAELPGLSQWDHSAEGTSSGGWWESESKGVRNGFWTCSHTERPLPHQLLGSVVSFLAHSLISYLQISSLYALWYVSPNRPDCSTTCLLTCLQTGSTLESNIDIHLHLGQGFWVINIRKLLRLSQWRTSLLAREQ